MRDILPGRPQAKLQAVTHGFWESNQIIAYISGNALIVLDSPNHVLQTTYLSEEDELEAVALDDNTGKLAVCSTRVVYIFQPYGYNVGAIKWSIQGSFSLPDAGDSIATLSWGMPNELLVGSASLTLFSTNGSIERIWSKRLANPVRLSHFSPDAELIASTGRYDRLLKIWRRLTFGSAEQSFDHYYLPHPGLVTSIYWRHPFHKEQTTENVLYTICTDHKLRIWVTGGHRGVEDLMLWTEIDLREAIKPHCSNRPSLKRYVFFIDGRYFTHATERAVELATKAEKDQMALNHLIEMANRNPEVCVVLDDQGNMSALGFENLGSRVKNVTDVFPVAHVEGLQLHFTDDPSFLQDNAQFYAFCHERPDSAFTILAHHFDGRIEWLHARMDHLIDPSPSQTERIMRKAVWTGHSHPIKKVNRTPSGRALISRTVTDECIVWTQKLARHGQSLDRHSTLNVEEHIHRTLLLLDGRFVVFLHHEHVALWDSRGPVAHQVARQSYRLDGKPLCLVLLPESSHRGPVIHVATISSKMHTVCWEINLPSTVSDRRMSQTLSGTTNGHSNGESSLEIKEFARGNLGVGDDLAFVLPVDPAGSAPVPSNFLDTFARDVAISCTTSGLVRSWTAKIDQANRQVDWLQTCTVDTGVANPSLASATSTRKAALVDAGKTTLTIWNTRGAQLEFEEGFEGNGVVQDLDWSTTPDNQSILAVGFPHRVLVYVQLRYDYLNAGPSWIAIRDIQVRDTSPHPVGDSVWLGSGNLVIGSGNQLFVLDENVEVSESLFPSLRTMSRKSASFNLFSAVSRLNGPLPAYHPQLLSQCVLAGKLTLVHRILLRLYQKLKFYTDGDELESSLDILPEEFSDSDEAAKITTRKGQQASYADLLDDNEPEAVTEEVASSLNELLQVKQIPLLSSSEQFRLADIVECVGTAEKHRRSVDQNARRFLLYFRQHVTNGARNKPISWREIIWAFHSQSQDILVDLVSKHFSGRLMWEKAKQSGLCMWLSDAQALRTQFEVIARNEYSRTEERNPVDCSLYYLALKKKAVLVGLWRMATWSREQGATYRLLSNNFNDERWKTAALKNAYALMGKRRFEYAAAFFLLADHLLDAISVLYNQLGDTQLAIAVARVYAGDDSPVLIEFLKTKVLPQAAREGNRWLATWAFWLLNKRDSAVRSLITPLQELIQSSESPDLQSRSYLNDDPALVVLYKQLREKSLQTLRGASMVGMKEEWDFVLHTAELYDRMGCDVLALDLVKTWEFLAPPPVKLRNKHPPLSPAIPRSSFRANNANQASVDFDFDPRKLLRRRSSLVVADLPPREHVAHSMTVCKSSLEEASSESEQGENHKPESKPPDPKKPPPTQFQEPEANSLLDAFGF